MNLCFCGVAMLRQPFPLIGCRSHSVQSTAELEAGSNQHVVSQSQAVSAVHCCFCCSAAEHIQRGEAELMLAGGAEAAIIPSGLGGFIACKALSRRNEDPTKASRPWDKNRDGFVMGEGAGKHCHQCFSTPNA